MDLKEVVVYLTDLIWAYESEEPKAEKKILSYVQDFVVAEIEHRRWMCELDQRLLEIQELIDAKVLPARTLSPERRRRSRQQVRVSQRDIFLALLMMGLIKARPAFLS